MVDRVREIVWDSHVRRIYTVRYRLRHEGVGNEEGEFIRAEMPRIQLTQLATKKGKVKLKFSISLYIYTSIFLDGIFISDLNANRRRKEMRWFVVY